VGYGRYGNPSWTALEDAVGQLEGGRAVAFASGMAAVTSLLDSVPLGGVVVAPKHAYSGSLGLLADLVETGRITTRLVDVADTAAVVAACDGAALVWLESPSNPQLEVADLRACCAAARDAGALAVVDSTPPRLVACTHSSHLATTASAASAPPSTSIETMPPYPSICSLAR
jgi:cystathionine gamma-synthase